MSKACVFLADGFEEVEAITPVDLMRRAGIEVVTVAIGESRMVRGRSSIALEADELFSEADMEDADLLVLPGGMPGTKNLENHKGLSELIERFYKQGKKLGAICAAPMIYGHMGLLKDKKATIYEGMEDELYGALPCKDDAVTDGIMTTSRGAGTAIPFALELIRVLEGEEKAVKVKNEILYNK